MARKLLFVFVVLTVGLATGANSLELKNGAYEDLVVSVGQAVPVKNCKAILANLEATLTSASQYLFSALDGRAFLRSTTVILPPNWPDSCVSKPVVSGSGEISDATIVPTGPARGRLWTQQSAGCGQQGDQIYIGFESLERRDDTLARSLVKQFAMYRYGVFEEQGYTNDPIYPMCYHDDHSRTVKVTGCSDLPILDNGICSGTSNDYNTTKMVDDKARSSIMFAAEAPSVSMFCDEGTHDRYAPTKHNLICQRRSTFEVLINHRDFVSNAVSAHQNSQIQNTTPKITYKKYNITRFVLVIENTKDMLQRESWRFLRTAVRKWAFNDLPENANVEVGLVLTNETGAVKLLNVLPMKGGLYNRDLLSSAIPYTPGEFGQTPCLHCALKEALEMLNERTKNFGPASNAIVVIAPGMNTNANVQNLVKEANKSRVKITTINYPDVIRTQTLDILAEGTGGKAYTVTEKKVNVEASLLSTYFQLSNVLYNVLEIYLSSTTNLPMEIHRREIRNDGRNSITGSFVLDGNMGSPARFMLYTHDTESPLIKSLTLTSPSQEVFTRRSDIMLTSKIITLTANITETGTWTYTIEPFVGNPQPHFLQVMATPKTKTAPIVRAKFWTKRNTPGSPLVLYSEIKRGDYPVMSAKVEVLVTKSETNGTVMYKETFELLDTGSGDPDITKGDGIYTRYFSAAAGGPGTYTFQVTATDNGNTAYSWSESSNRNEDKPCCGSTIRTSNVEPISPFQRVLPPRTIEISSNDIISASLVAAGRIGDLRVEVVPEDMKARLTWTSPDMGGHHVARYEIKYANNVEEIVEKFDTNAIAWEGRTGPFPLAPGSETTYSVDMNSNRDLLDKPLYFAIRAYAQASSDSKPGAASNWVRVLVPSPPPPPTVAPTYTTNDSSWPFQSNSAGSDSAGPRISKSMSFGLEVVLPIAIGVILLIVLLVLYCYFCVVKRRDRGNHKKPSKSNQIKTDKLNSNITIVPSSPTIVQQESQQESYANDYPDHHTIGVPVSNYAYEDEPKKRYSLVHQQEQQLIEELKQQQMHRDQMGTPNNNYGGLSVISNNTLQRNGHTLSPYNSWSASQLLNEHDRRHSPLENMMQDDQHQDALSQLDRMSINGQTPEHVSMNGHQIMSQIPEHYVQGHVPPPVPPLPAFNQNGYPINYNIYGVHQPQINQQAQHQIYQSMQRNEALVPFNSSLQGSMTSVNSGEKKRRNVTMV